MATKLNQLLAAEKGVKASVKTSLDNFYHRVQKAPLLSGIARHYTPKDDDGDRLPSESTKVQVHVEEELRTTAQQLIRLFDITFDKDSANTRAMADVVVDGNVLIQNAPVTYLLFLEKQLVNLHTVVSKLPTLDPAETWMWDESKAVWVTEMTDTVKTKKVPRSFIKYEATDKHPAQVEMFTEDQLVGTWHTVKFSGTVPQTRVNQLKERVEKLQTAVKFARETANNTEVVDVGSVGDAVLNYVLNG